jgi:hypothetical protein
MILKRIALILFVQMTVTAASCFKIPEDELKPGYLKFSRSHVNITNRVGDLGAVLVESDIAWKLSVQTPVPDWMVLDKQSGKGRQSLVVKATRNNSSGAYRFATVIATPVNQSNIAPAILTVVQYDSTTTGK